MSTITFSGYLHDDAGDPISGATANMYTANTTTPVIATDTTDASGRWDLTHTSDNDGTDKYDVELVNGTSKRRIKYNDAIQVLNLETASFTLRNPADTYVYDILPAAIVADRTLTLPLLTGTATVVVTPGIEDLDMSGFDIDNAGFLILNAATAPANSEVYAVNDNTGDLTLNALSGKTINLAIAGADEVIVSASGLTLPANSDLLFAGTTGTNDLNLVDSVADALSIVRGSTDFMVFNTSTPLLTITPAVTVTGIVTAASGSVFGNVTVADGSITASGGSISFGDETIATTGTLASGELTVTGNIVFNESTNNLTLAALDQGTAARTATIPDLGGTNDTFAFLAASQTLVNKTLTTPTIGNLSNMNHNHSGATTGGVAVSASATVVGVVELATLAELETGTDTGRAVVPDILAGSNFGERVVQVVAFDFTTDTATGNGAYYFHVPSTITGMNLVEVHAEVITAGTTNTTDIQIANVTQGADMLSTVITVDSGETGSDTAATAAVINTSEDDVTTNDILRIDVDAVSSTEAKGLIITMTFRLP